MRDSASQKGFTSQTISEPSIAFESRSPFGCLGNAIEVTMSAWPTRSKSRELVRKLILRIVLSTPEKKID